jgi:hypothetical protein
MIALKEHKMTDMQGWILKEFKKRSVITRYSRNLCKAVIGERCDVQNPGFMEGGTAAGLGPSRSVKFLHWLGARIGGLHCSKDKDTSFTVK